MRRKERERFARLAQILRCAKNACFRMTIKLHHYPIKAFAGPEYEKAVYYPKDKKFLLELDPNVTHYEVPQSG